MTEHALPMGARLVHLGPPKTGTTALQTVVGARRPALLAAGTRYPGEGSHQRGVSALLGRAMLEVDGEARVPGEEHWRALVDELAADPERRGWISHEVLADADTSQIERMRADLGPALHAVMTLRPLASLLPSGWQQRLKTGFSAPYGAWLRRSLDPDPTEGPERPWAAAVRRRMDHGGLVERWAAVLGPENVTVVVLDPRDPGFLFRSFETLLALPEGTLAPGASDGQSDNRGFSAPEAELFRLMNKEAKSLGVERMRHHRVLRGGAMVRVQKARTPGAEEPRLVVPDRMAEVVDRLSAEVVARVEASGVRVLGELARLRPAPQAGAEPPLETVPVDLAATAIAGALSGVAGRGASFGTGRRR